MKMVLRRGKGRKEGEGEENEERSMCKGLESTDPRFWENSNVAQM